MFPIRGNEVSGSHHRPSCACGSFLVFPSLLLLSAKRSAVLPSPSPDPFACTHHHAAAVVARVWYILVRWFSELLLLHFWRASVSLLVVHQVKTVNSQSRYEALSSLLRDLDGSAIVYVMTKKDAEQLAVDVSETFVS